MTIEINEGISLLKWRWTRYLDRYRVRFLLTACTVQMYDIGMHLQADENPY